MKLQEFISLESNTDALPGVTPVAQDMPDPTQMLYDHSAASAELEKLLAAKVALEQYTSLLGRYQHDGLTDEAASFLHAGLEAYQGLLSEPLPSVESFGGSIKRRYATQISLESLKDTLTKTGVAIIALLKKLGHLTLEAYKAVVLNTTKIAERLTQVKAQLSKVGNDEPRQARIQVSNPAPLFIGKQFVGDDVTALNELVKAVCYTYPKEVEAYLNKLSMHLAGFHPRGSAVELMLKLTSTVGPGSTLDDGKVYPGNVRVQRVMDKDKDADDQTFAQGITLVRAEAPTTASYDKEVDEPAQLLSRIHSLQELIKLMGSLQTQGAGIPAAMNHLGGSISRLQKMASVLAESHDKNLQAEASTLRQVMSEMDALQNLVGTESMKVYSYLHRALSTYTALVKHEADQYA